MASVAVQNILRAADNRAAFFNLPSDTKGLDELKRVCREVGISLDSMVNQNGRKKGKRRLTHGQIQFLAKQLKGK